MIAVPGYYENNLIRLLEPVPDAVMIGRRARVAVLFLDTYAGTPAVASSQLKAWGEDEDSREQAALLRTIREVLAPYVVQAMEVAASEEDWEAILG